MNNNQVKKTSGHTVSFMFWGALLLIAMYGVGSMLNPTNFAYQSADFLAILVVLVIWVILGGLLNVWWFGLIFHTSLSSVFSGMKKTDHTASFGYENISRAFVAGGWYLVAAQLLAFASAPTFRLFLYNFLTRGSIAMLAAAIVVILVSVFFLGVHSVEAFKQWFDNPQNNQVVLMVMVLVNAAVLIAMHVKI